MKTADELEHTTWRSAVTDFGTGQIRLRGVPIEDLMRWGSFGDVVFLLFAGRRPTLNEAKLFNAILIAASDHGPTSPSTLAARVIASGNRRAPEAAVGGGLLAIGDAHGGAGEAAMEMLQTCLDRVSDGRSIEEVAADYVESTRSAGRRLPGLGHRFHDDDPRTVELWAQASAAGVSDKPIAMMSALERALEQASGRRLPVNVDGAIAALLLGMTFEPLVARLVFIIGRCAGVAAHVREELEREKPMRIRFPFVYDGPSPAPSIREVAQ